MWRQNEKDDEKDEERCRTRNESEARVCGGENILELAGDAEDLLSVVLCMKKLKGETKHRQTCQQSTKRWQSEGVHSMASWELLWVQRVMVVGVGMGDRLVTGVRLWLQGMQIGVWKKTTTVRPFSTKRKEGYESGRLSILELILNLSLKCLTEGSAVFIV